MKFKKRQQSLYVIGVLVISIRYYVSEVMLISESKIKTFNKNLFFSSSCEFVDIEIHFFFKHLFKTTFHQKIKIPMYLSNQDS